MIRYNARDPSRDLNVTSSSVQRSVVTSGVVMDVVMGFFTPSMYVAQVHVSLVNINVL